VPEADLKPVYLLSGSDRPKIARALRRLRDRFDADGIELLNAVDTSGDEAVAACNALGLFGAGRLVVVEDVEGWKAADAKAVAEYLAGPAPGTVLALVGEGLKKDSPLAKACGKKGELLFYDVQKRELAPWIAEQFGRVGASAEPAACRTLVELVGENLVELAGEVEKLATWADGDTITAADVERLAAGRAETSIFALTDSWGRRDVKAVLSACESLLERGQGARSGEIPRIVGMLGTHFDRVRQCQAAAATGVSVREVASKMKRSPYYVEKLFGQASNFTADELRDAVVRLADLDLALKGNSRLSGDLELQRALVDMTRPRESGERAV
jgi:DNA polymerase-3 subunit delta